MLPIRLEIRNFLAYRSPEPLVFEGIHLACLTGPNGAGKSSLLDAITWALWGRARTRSDDDLIHQGQSEMQCNWTIAGRGALSLVRSANGQDRPASDAARRPFAWDEAKQAGNRSPGRRSARRRMINEL